jgi:hypothetical protein
MSGEKNLKANTGSGPTPSPAAEEVRKWDRILDEYESKTGLMPFLPNYANSEASYYMTMDRKQIEKLTPIDCGAASLVLNELAFHVQRAYNREIARVNWSDSTIKSVLATEVNNYKGYSYAERLQQAIKGNSHARKLWKINIYAKQRADRLGFLASSISNRVNIFLSIQRNKRT